MVEFIYGILNSIGYNEPIHPVATHIPMGMVLGGFLFALGSLKWNVLEKTAYYCLVLALLNLPITISFGILDWLHRYHGTFTSYIIAKMILAGTVTLVISLTVFRYHKGNMDKKFFLSLYFLIFAITVALGFIGGKLVFGG